MSFGLGVFSLMIGSNRKSYHQPQTGLPNQLCSGLLLLKNVKWGNITLTFAP